MTTNTKTMLGRIYAYVVAGLVVALIGSVVFTAKTMKRDTEEWQATIRMADAGALIMHVDDSINLCYNLGFIPYPLNWYIGEEAYQLMKPR